MTLVDDDLPVVTPGGTLYDKRSDYVNGRSVLDVSVDSTDAGSGVTRNWVERSGSGQVAGGSAPCDATHLTDVLDNRICPQSYRFVGSVDLNPFPEGVNTFVAKSSDVALNVGSSESWEVFIDRTAPAPASGITLQYFVPATGELGISWAVATRDPDLPGGIPGSGVAREEYRINRGGTWSAWTETYAEGLDLTNGVTGETILVEVRSWDAVGNASATSSGSVTAVAKTFVQPDPGPRLPPDPNARALDDASAADFVDDTSLFLAFRRPSGGQAWQGLEHHIPINAPSYTYRRKDARVYAYKYVGTQHWPKVEGSVSTAGWNNAVYLPQGAGALDCTNFASQVIHAGGVSFTQPITTASATADNAWWADKSLTSVSGS